MYGPFLNTAQTNAFDVNLLLSLPFALALVAAWRMLRAPITALLPSGLRLPETSGRRAFRTGPATPSGCCPRP
ncbi:hypothetical protein ACFUIW_28620 [Streptomyces sp. NPDC057245]|uniref:hypothetical protein n=1 Tax=Streptomyces sp. NPDC057245 TaxID=3346065 RepID=UPI003630F00A